MQRSVTRDSATMRELFIRPRQSRMLSFSRTTSRKDVHSEKKKKIEKKRNIDHYSFRSRA